MTNPAIHFDEFTLDPERRELRRAGDRIAVGPQVFDLLLFLVRERHRVVSKDDLIASVWAGRIVSDSTLTSHLNAVRKALGDTGKEQRLVRTVSRKGVRFVGEVHAEATAVASMAEPGSVEPALALPDKPSIAVLPFQNMSGDGEQQYFADGMAEDIITALSRFKSLFVIARNSSFAYAGRTVDVRQVGRELGVRYVLEGSVRRSGNMVRFTAQLVDSATAAHVWADRYDGPLESLFELQDRLTEAVVGVLEPAIQRAEIERARRKRPEHMGAHDHYLRSQAHTDGLTRASVELLLSAALQAIALDPSFAPAFALAARAHIQRNILGLDDDPAETRREVMALVERGLAADRLDPLMLATAAHCVAMFEGDFAKAIAYADEAVELNPNQAHAFLHSAWVRLRIADTRMAIEHVERAMRLSPRDLRSYALYQVLAVAYHLQGDPETGRLWARRSVQHNPNYISGWYALAASAAATGRMDEALAATGELMRLDSGFSIAVYLQRTPMGAVDRYAPFIEGMRKAGIPE